MSRKANVFRRALFPTDVSCAACGREAVVDDGGLCEDCRQGLELFVSAPPPDHTDGYSAAFIYNDVSAAMVKKLKYNGAKYEAEKLASFLDFPEDWEIDAVVPVPLHYRRLRKRGFNQSELIAKHLCRRTGLKLMPELLVRRSDTKQQARMTEAARKRNVRNAFIADDACKGLNILLLDDVRTTGATLSACAKELKDHGCGKAYALTVCFAKPAK